MFLFCFITVPTLLMFEVQMEEKFVNFFIMCTSNILPSYSRSLHLYISHCTIYNRFFLCDS